MDRLKNNIVEKLIPDVLNGKSNKTPEAEALKKYIQDKKRGTIIYWSTLASFKKVSDDKYELSNDTQTDQMEEDKIYGQLIVSKKSDKRTIQEIQQNIELKIIGYTKKGKMCGTIAAKKGKSENRVDLYEKITGKIDETIKSIDCRQIEMALRERDQII